MQDIIEEQRKYYKSLYKEPVETYVSNNAYVSNSNIKNK